MEEAQLQHRVIEAFENRGLLKESAYRDAVLETVARLDSGALRVATQLSPGNWTTHAWVKQAVLLYFAVSPMERWEAGPFEFHDKIPLKRGLEQAGVRLVPPGTIRYGAFVEPGA
ncbi:MAG TPA: 2,3,4,5-tetrahydropyridine-2,6-dicarboxylate N-succinyltransferase, partial [Polyangiaceae bacterium]